VIQARIAFVEPGQAGFARPRLVARARTLYIEYPLAILEHFLCAWLEQAKPAFSFRRASMATAPFWAMCNGGGN